MRKLASPWLIFLLTVGFAVLLAGCGGGPPTTVSQEIIAAEGGTVSLDGAITVRIPPGALSTDATVKITRPSGDAPSSLESALPVGAAFNVDLGGAALTKPVTIEMAYDPDLLPVETPREVAFLAFYDEALEEWQPVYGTVDLDKHVIVIETDHLSLWQPFTWDIFALADAIMSKLNSLFEAAGLPSAEIPDCGRAPTDMTLDFSETLLPCLEESGGEGEALLKVANNRAYAVLLDLPRSEPRHRVEEQGVTRGSLYDAAWEAIVDKLAEDLVYVPPAAEAQIAMQFADEGGIRILSAPSDLTLGIEVLLSMLAPLDPQAVIEGVECLYKVISAGGEEPLTFGDLVDIAKDCASAVLDGTLAIVWNVVRNFVTLGAATGELFVDRTLGDGEGFVTVTYSPRDQDDTPQTGTTPGGGPEPTVVSREPGPTDAGGGLSFVQNGVVIETSIALPSGVELLGARADEFEPGLYSGLLTLRNDTSQELTGRIFVTGRTPGGRELDLGGGYAVLPPRGVGFGHLVRVVVAGGNRIAAIGIDFSIEPYHTPAAENYPVDVNVAITDESADLTIANNGDLAMSRLTFVCLFTDGNNQPLGLGYVSGGGFTFGSSQIGVSSAARANAYSFDTFLISVPSLGFGQEYSHEVFSISSDLGQRMGPAAKLYYVSTFRTVEERYLVSGVMTRP